MPACERDPDDAVAVDVHSAPARWCVGKQVSIKVNFLAFGSYMGSWRVARWSGNTLADGWVDPFLQKSWFSGGRILAVTQTRAFSSSIGLWWLDSLSHIG